MQDRHREPLRALAATAAILAVTLSLALSAGLAYASEDEEEDVPLDTKLFRQFMKDIGAQRDGHFEPCQSTAGRCTDVAHQPAPITPIRTPISARPVRSAAVKDRASDRGQTFVTAYRL